MKNTASYTKKLLRFIKVYQNLLQLKIKIQK